MQTRADAEMARRKDQLLSKWPIHPEKKLAVLYLVSRWMARTLHPPPALQPMAPPQLVQPGGEQRTTQN
ncbi:hypothetical protein G6O67_005842 [Ophiocordyceps sinensis]|uniref:Uncharacterized protein n=1 Tax=Ophiocordyceps sinensis TaxID=72228 RepID=A0A8H4LY24_9HYPO|nr:hypothetical protein G6O67_005842 [Ophiocordyceps sinensis]